MANPPSREVDDLILAAFRDRDVPVRRSDLTVALEDAGFRAWATGHLAVDNLLTRDELKLYEKLESSGQLKVIQAQQQRRPPIRPLWSSEVREAIETLRESTAATERQSEILRAQCRTLQRRMREDADRNNAERAMMRRLYDKHEIERQRSEREIEDRINDLELILSPAEASIVAEKSTVLPQVSSILKEHDRVLETLGKASVFDAHKADTDDDNSQVVKRMRTLTDMLQQYTADAVKSRLDRVYLECTRSGEEDDVPKDGLPADEIEEEIATLYADIDDLIAMIVRQEHEVPILRSLQSTMESKRKQVTREFDFVCDSMDRIGQSLTDITERLKTRQSYCVALHHLSEIYRETIANRTNASEKLRTDVVALRRQNSARRRPMGLGIMLTPTAATTRRQSEGGDLPAALTALLKQQNVDVSGIDCTGACSDTISKAPYSTTSTSNPIHRKVEDIHASLESPGSLPHEALLSYHHSADTTSQLVSDALMADAKFAAGLINEDQERELEKLADMTTLSLKKLHALDTDAAHRRDPAREEFLRRWAVN